MKATIEKFAEHMREAEKCRHELKTRYGLNDLQIGTLALATQKGVARLGASPMNDALGNFATAALAAKRNLEARGIIRQRKATMS